MPRIECTDPAPEPKEAETLRTGPLIRRGAHVARVAQGAPSTFRPAALPRLFGNQALPAVDFHVPIHGPALGSSSVYLECGLPINLRHLLAKQLGSNSSAGDETILNLAAHADKVTMSKLARAIRHYSTTRAHEAWAECSVPLAKFKSEGGVPAHATLCLECKCVEFGINGARSHEGPGCLAVSLGSASTAKNVRINAGAKIPESMQRLIEGFRTLRATLGLPHFELDCYVRANQLTFTSRPIT